MTVNSSLLSNTEWIYKVTYCCFFRFTSSWDAQACRQWAYKQ